MIRKLRRTSICGARVWRSVCKGGEGDSHAGLDDNVAEVLDSLGGLQLFYQLLLVHVHTKAEKYNISIVNKYSQLRNAVLSPGKFTWWQGARREAGAVILSSNPHLICTIEEKNSLSSNRAGLREATEGVVEAVECVKTGAASSLLFLATD